MAPRLAPPRGGTAVGGKTKQVASVNAVSRTSRGTFRPEQRLLLLDTWRRSGLPAADFASLVGVSTHTLYAWRKRFEESGPAGLEDPPQGSKGKSSSNRPELAKRLAAAVCQPDCLPSST
ncbi:MAG: helix-turn-helix domain-containing protein [Pirellulaceae bacterium]|nr:helix-turn-helix domain-containing protein [Planctomycetales bacterium]